MTEDASDDANTERIAPAEVERELLRLFDTGTLRAGDFDRPPQEIAEEIRTQAAAYNRIVRPAADLSGDILQATTGRLAETFDSLEDPDGEVQPPDELADEFEQDYDEGSEAVRTADEILNVLVPLYVRSQMHTGESFTFLDVYRDVRDVSPETAKMYSGVIEVLSRADVLSDYGEDT
ncbi:hypothetical protein [Halosimplex halophilum]|uniref:hypothetical protein n=1 Tax=Halosimplex halophilum TaxID=2559572 RepID=UPI00107F0E09|nr:hypothetical protein [Halosimplex halophilum]